MPARTDGGAHQAGASRRQFLAAAGKGAVLALTMFGAGPRAAARGLFGRGLLPSAWDTVADSPLPKPGMIVHGEQPFNGEFRPTCSTTRSRRRRATSCATTAACRRARAARI